MKVEAGPEIMENYFLITPTVSALEPQLFPPRYCSESLN